MFTDFNTHNTRCCGLFTFFSFICNYIDNEKIATVYILLICFLFALLFIAFILSYLFRFVFFSVVTVVVVAVVVGFDSFYFWLIQFHRVHNLLVAEFKANKYNLMNLIREIILKISVIETFWSAINTMVYVQSSSLPDHTSAWNFDTESAYNLHLFNL